MSAENRFGRNGRKLPPWIALGLTVCGLGPRGALRGGWSEDGLGSFGGW